MIIDFFISNNYDYVANFGVLKKDELLTVDSTYPSGTEVEMFTFDSLERAWKNAKNDEEREHVTPYMYMNPEKFRIKTIHQTKNLSHLRWSLDYDNDLILIREIIKN